MKIHEWIIFGMGTIVFGSIIVIITFKSVNLLICYGAGAIITNIIMNKEGWMDETR